MRYIFIFNPVALKEYKEAIIWYHEKSEIAAGNFIKEIQDKVTVICEDPFRFRNSYKDYRETSLKKFPYTIVYRVKPTNFTVIITSIFHQKRNPAKKYDK